MGVQGLWKLVAPCGKMIPLEAMANKVLAIDVSIWLHQALTGVHEMDGSAAALLLLFHRLCKLLFYRIKPVFVFDGGVPAIKRQTMATRRMRKNKARSEATRIRGKLLKNMLKHEALRKVLSDGNLLAPDLTSFTLPGPSEKEDLYKLPDNFAADSTSESGSDNGSIDAADTLDLDSVDVTSNEFRSLPAELRHDILSDLKDTRKQNSWRNIDQMPNNSQDFSDYQMNRLLKRRAIQVSLEECGKEMEEKDVSMQDLQHMLGNVAAGSRIISGRIAQDDSTRYLLVQNVPEKTKNLANTSASKIAPIDEEILKVLEHGFEDEPKEEPNKDVDPQLITKQETLESQETNDEASQKLIEKLLKEQNEEAIRETEKVIQQQMEDDSKKLIERLLSQDEPEIVPNMEETKQPFPVAIAESCQKFASPKENQKNENLSKSESSEPEELPKNIQATVETPETANSKKPTVLPIFEKIETVSPIVEKPLLPIFERKPEIPTNFQTTAKSPEKIEKPTKVPQETEKISEEIIKTIELTPTTEKIPEEIVKPTASLLSEPLDTIVENSSEEEDADDFIPVSLDNTIAAEKVEQLTRERNVLLEDQARQQRRQQTVTDQIYVEAQELLRLFGVPYIIAPMEAEAQCAMLETLGLTNGTITDDSDIWLFGGRVVYKDFFNQKKRVHQFCSEDIEKSLKLTRDELIRLAMLVGSDYTSGLTGVGPVTALEILASFPPNSATDDFLSGLISFREWLSSGFVNGPTRMALKKKLINTQLISGFPSSAVADAYFNPQVDKSNEPFSWSKPNCELLEKYTRIKFGWSSDRCKQQLSPVMKKLLDTNDQTSILRYFGAVPTHPSLDGCLSKRVEGAVKRLGRPCVEDVPKSQTSEVKSEILDPLTKRLHEKTIIPQRERDKIEKELIKKRAAKILKKGNNKKRKIVPQPAVINLSESSTDSD